MIDHPQMQQEIQCGRFRYRLALFARLPICLLVQPEDQFADAARFAQADGISGGSSEGFPCVALGRPDPADRVRVLLAWIGGGPEAADGSGPGRAELTASIQAMLGDAQAISSAFEKLGPLALRHRLQIQAIVIELGTGDAGVASDEDDTLERIMPKRFHAALAQERAREAELAYVQVCTAGLPPLIHVYSSDIVFPVRSWVPAGLFADWQPLCQGIECEVGNHLIVHTELDAAPSALKQFHDGLRAGQPDWSLFGTCDPDRAGDAPQATRDRARRGAGPVALALTIESATAGPGKNDVDG